MFMLGNVLVAIIGGVLGAGVMYTIAKDTYETRGKEAKRLKVELNQAKEHKEFWYSEYSSTVQQLRLLSSKYNALVDEHNALQRTPNANRELMKAAARKAMIASHPDKNPGKDTTADFIKFKKLYDQFK